MQKIECIRYLSNTDLSWIGNVFLTASSNSAKNLKALVKLHQNGIGVAPLSFTMPYEHLLVDGKVVTPEEMREIVKNI